MDGVIIDKTKGEEVVISGVPSMVENQVQEPEAPQEQELEEEEVIEEGEAESDEITEGEDNDGTGPQNLTTNPSSEKVENNSESIDSLKQSIAVLEQRSLAKDNYISSLKVRIEAQDAIVRTAQEALGVFQDFFSKESTAELNGAFTPEYYFKLKDSYLQYSEKLSNLGNESKLRAVGVQLDMNKDEAAALNAEIEKEWGSNAQTVVASTPINLLHSWAKGKLQEYRDNPNNKRTLNNSTNSQEDFGSFEKRIMTNVEDTVTRVLQQVLPNNSVAKPVVKSKSTVPTAAKRSGTVLNKTVKTKSGEVQRISGSLAI